MHVLSEMTAFTLLGGLVLFAMLWRLALIDGATYRLPDRLTLPLIAVGLLWSAAMQGEWPWGAVLGAVVGYGVFAVIGWAFWRQRGVEGLGLGDAKLLAAGGAWTGLTTLPWIVLIAATSALLAAAAKQSGKKDQIAFGPSLAASIGVCWVVRHIF